MFSVTAPPPPHTHAHRHACMLFRGYRSAHCSPAGGSGVTAGRRHVERHRAALVGSDLQLDRAHVHVVLLVWLMCVCVCLLCVAVCGQLYTARVGSDLQLDRTHVHVVLCCMCCVILCVVVCVCRVCQDHAWCALTAQLLSAGTQIRAGVAIQYMHEL